MKRVMLYSAAGLLLCLLAQPTIAQVSIGGKGGVNVSTLNGWDAGNLKSQALVGFHVGGWVAFNLGRNFALQPELVYSTQGAKIENATEDLKLNYFNVPIMLRFYTNSGLFLEGGPQLGFRTGDVSWGGDIGDELKGSDLSLCAGLGFMGKSQGFGVGARYNAGISKLGDFDSQNISPDFRNGVFQLSLYFRIFGGGKLKDTDKNN